MNQKVVVGLSGGVDSSVTAATLHNQGIEVVGLTLWLMKGGGQCCSKGMVDAAFICEQLGIPHHIIDTRELFQTYVIDPLVSGYESGVTPLPCSQCNKSVKFEPMLQYAREKFGIERIATGHYARIRYDEKSDRYQLLQAVDKNKDQSYFLYYLSQELLAGTTFPLGNQHKEETRRIATELGLKTADKPDSQDLCVADTYGSMQEFLDQYIDQKQGEIVNQEGKVLGQHRGVHHYTIGQRRGLGISAPEPLYVIELDAQSNRVIVGSRPNGYRSECLVGGTNWVSIPEPSSPIRAQVKVRSRTPAVPVTVIPLENAQMKLLFDEPEFSITPGQAAVLYEGELLLGGGTITKPEYNC
ncbi:MAG: tRNA 2-thiouridine(34) synthase MnmA [Cyanobacteria bacterium QH_8_48_120]|nr:MAG: tRNA 2-thiouridine(34) synthase MnmA [Cyanobacteria bacterium QH_8_48_120]